jgi:hypothetical protein
MRMTIPLFSRLQRSISPKFLTMSAPLCVQSLKRRTGCAHPTLLRSTGCLPRWWAMRQSPRPMTACTIAGHDGYTTRHAAYDLGKLRGKHLISRPGRTNR